jgi:hypothetical protein
MAYFDKHGVEFSDDQKTLVRCPKDFEGEYVIPEGTKTIDSEAFVVCTGLTSVTMGAGIPPTLGNDALVLTNNCPIYVPCGTLDAYKNAWPEYASRIH